MTHDLSYYGVAASIVDLVSHDALGFSTALDVADQSSRLAIYCCSVAPLKIFDRRKLLLTACGVDSTNGERPSCSQNITKIGR